MICMILANIINNILIIGFTDLLPYKLQLAAMFRDKGLEAHPDKTCFIVCGSAKYKQKVEQDLVRNPLVFGHFPVKQHVADRYLGQVLHGGGLDQSAKATVQERAGRIKGATMEIILQGLRLAQAAVTELWL